MLYDDLTGVILVDETVRVVAAADSAAVAISGAGVLGVGAVRPDSEAQGRSADVQDPVEDARSRRYRLVAAGRRLLPENKRLQECHRRPVPGSQVELWRHAETHRAHYQHLIECGQVWTCPVCSSKISERRRNELQGALDRYTGGLVMATFTLQHSIHTPLEQVWGELQVAWRGLHAGRVYQELVARFGIVGMITSREVTYSDLNGWHPHLHAVILLAGSMSEECVGELEAALSREWIHQVKEAGAFALAPWACRVEHAHASAAEYVTKWGPDYDADDTAHGLAERSLHGWRAADELCRSIVKRARHGRNPWQLLDDFDQGDRHAGELFKEYAKAVAGSHQLQWSRGLRDLLGLGVEEADDEVVEEVEEGCTLLHRFTREEWTAVLSNDCAAVLLEAAERLEQAELEQFIMSLAS